MFKPRIKPTMKIKNYILKKMQRFLSKHEHFKKLEVMSRTAIKWHVKNTVTITLQESLIYNGVDFILT